MLMTTGTVTADVPSGRERARQRLMKEIGDREIDIAFMAGRTPRRERFIAVAAGMLWEWRTDLRFSDQGDHPSLARARIVLNVHGSNIHDFDWTGVVEAIANGCVVASETSVGYEPLVPGVHFLMAPYEHLAEQAIALAFDEPRRAAMAEAASRLAASESSLKVPASTTRTGATSAPARRRRRRRRRSSSPMKAEGLRRLLSELRAAYLAQLAQTRSIEASISLVEHQDPDHADFASTSAWPSFVAEVSVVVPMFNQGRHLIDTVHSVISAGGESSPRTELLIIDDHSTDDSRDVAEALLAQIDWFPGALIARAANGGPAVARNVGFTAARAPHVLTLDAGSTLFPTALRRLLDPLEIAPSDVIATYGIVEQFDTTGSLGLTSDQPWDTELLVRGRFVDDDIAMFRREAWSQLGGFAGPTTVEDGWAGYDLWLSVAERGMRADYIGSIVGRSRQQPSALLKISDVDKASTFVTLRERHPRLPWNS